MKSAVMVVAGAGLIAMTVVPVRYGTFDLRLGLVVALAAALFAYWIDALAELLRRGPGAQRDWWLAALAIVVFLGPIGALAYRVASPRFAAHDEHLHRTRL
jgi:hypothetical protein